MTFSDVLNLVGDIMTSLVEDDFPKGHPKRSDYDPASPAAREWARINMHPRGERDFPVGHPKAIDTPGNENHIAWEPGVDPHRPELEPFTGRTPEQVEGARALYAEMAALSVPTPPRKPIDAAAFTTHYVAECERLGVNALSDEQYDQLLISLDLMPQGGKA